MTNQLQRRSTAFVTAPIGFLAAAAFLVALAILIAGSHETDRLVVGQQRQTIERALRQRGRSLARELRLQTVWYEAFVKTLARDQIWIRAFYGEYLGDLLGYDGIYVLSSDDKIVFGFADGRDETRASFEQLAPEFEDLVAAIRKPGSASANYDIIATPIAFADGPFAEHRAVADVRNIMGTPATVVVSTIVPDRPVQEARGMRPFLLVTVSHLDAPSIAQLGDNFGVRGLRWIDGTPEPENATGDVTALDGSVVGTLAWRPDPPGREFVREVALSVGGALALLGTLALLLMQWGRKQARQLLQSEAEARQARSSAYRADELGHVGAHPTIAAE